MRYFLNLANARARVVTEHFVAKWPLIQSPYTSQNLTTVEKRLVLQLQCQSIVRYILKTVSVASVSAIICPVNRYVFIVIASEHSVCLCLSPVPRDACEICDYLNTFLKYHISIPIKNWDNDYTHILTGNKCMQMKYNWRVWKMRKQ